jgi:hypothetical protein
MRSGRIRDKRKEIFSENQPLYCAGPPLVIAIAYNITLWLLTDWL